ncbi:MAG: hypothetical protein M1823_004097 [Watsoniomyces obsoletus]|nr:MAG: hypothetical protein M1823_004097 [Watsoniomyces obsoletus]
MQGFLLGQLSIVLFLGAFIKFFIFGEAPNVDSTASGRRRLSGKSSHGSLSWLSSSRGSQKKSNNSSDGGKTLSSSHILRQQQQQPHLPLSTTTILEKTYYNVNSHLPESVDWFNVLFAQTIAQFRSDAQHDNAILISLNDIFNGPQKPSFLDEIKITELSLGEDFPIFSNCRVIPVEEDGGTGEGGAGTGGGGGGRLQARMDVDLSDAITLGVETKLVLNYPRPVVAVLPVALTVSVVRFTGTLSISFIPSSPPAPSPTTLAFSFSDDYRLELATHSLLGSRSRLQDVPKIAQIIEARLHAWFDERCVEPRFQQIVLPSLWPRKKNTRGGGEQETEDKEGDGDVRSGNVRSSQEGNKMEVEPVSRERSAREGDEQPRRRARAEQSGYQMPRSMPGLAEA